VEQWAIVVVVALSKGECAVRKFVFSAAILVTLILGPQVANASNFSFTGSFVNDNDVQFFNFSVGAPSNITIETYSYAGGTNAAGTVIPAGGFDTNLSVFDATGLLIGVNNDGTGVVPVDPVTGAAFDALLQFNSTLSPGNYLVALTQSDNLANGPTLADGFHQDGIPNFTASEFGCVSINFCDATLSIRTNQWALDILNVASADEVGAATPLPASLQLFASGLGALGLLGWRRKRKDQAAA
jgi:hypothetical protein